MNPNAGSTGYFHEILPWNFITKFGEGVVVHKDGNLQKTFAYRAPDIDSSADHEVASLAIRVNDFAKRLGSGWAVHLEAQRFFITDYPTADFSYRHFPSDSYQQGSFSLLAPYLIDRERLANFSAAGNHFETSYYLTFSYRPPSENVKKLASLFIQSASQAKTESNARGMRENVENFINEINAVVGILAQNILIQPLNNQETAAYLHSAISMNRFPQSLPHTSILLDRILPDEELVTSLTMRLGDYYIPIIGVNDFPEETYPAILDALNRARLEYRWVSRFICLDKEEGKNEAQKKEKAHRGSQKTFLQTLAETTSGEAAHAINHGASVKEGDSIEAGVEIETDQASLGFYTSCVMVWDKSYKAAKQKADEVKNIINSQGFTCKEETFNALEAFKSMMPGNVYSNFRALPVMSYTLSHVLPLSSVWAGARYNAHAEKVSGCGLPHITCSTNEGTPFFLNLNVGDVGHTTLWGPTGAGKSTLLDLAEMQFLKYPDSQVIVYDKGKSCRGPCLACGGLFFEPASENSAAGIAFQPLRDLESETDLMSAQDFIEACLTVNEIPVTPDMRSAIKQTLEHMRTIPQERRTITSFVQYSAGNYNAKPDDSKPEFKTMLGDYLWAGGKYGKIFDSESSGLSLNTRFLAIEMEELMNRGKECVVPALVYLFNLTEKKFDGRLTLLVLDEAWVFLKNPIFAEKIAEWLKVLRKKNVFVIFATQDVADAANSPLRTTIIQQCLTKIYLADPSAATPGMAEVYRSFGLSDTEINLLAAARMKRDYFYTSPSGRRLFQLDLGPVTLALIGGQDHEALDSMVAAKGRGAPLCADILQSRGINYSHLVGKDAPPADSRPGPAPVAAPLPPPQPPRETAAPQVTVTGNQSIAAAAAAYNMEELLAAAAELSEHKPGRKGSDGRAAQKLAQRFGVSSKTIFRARKIIKSGDEELLQEVRSGKLSIRQAENRLKAKAPAPAPTPPAPPQAPPQETAPPVEPAAAAA